METNYTPIATRYVEEAAAFYGVTFDQILGKAGNRKVCIARASVMWRLRKDGLSLPRIGRLMQRHHTTVMSCLRVSG